MIGCILALVALVALVALGRTKAIISNNCRKDVYLWSVPEKPHFAVQLSIAPGERYEEPWRSGTATNPGIAIKVSTASNGIYAAKSEIDFQYSVDPWDDWHKVWVSLANVRGTDLDSVTAHTCLGSFNGPDVAIQQCWSTDDIELVLCGSERTVPARDTAPFHIISSCIHHSESQLQPRMCSGRVVGPKRVPMHPQTVEHVAETRDTVPLKTVMRLETAKHAISQPDQTHGELHVQDPPATYSESVVLESPRSDPPTLGPLCAMVQQKHSDAECDEATAMVRAKEFYHDNCGSSTWDMFSGTHCQDLRRALEQVYPDLKTKRPNYPLCISKYYPIFNRFCGSSYMGKEVLNDQDIAGNLFTDRSWTFRKKGGVLAGDCNDMKEKLEHLSKNADSRIDWTSDDDVWLYKRGEPATRRDNTTSLGEKRAVSASIFQRRENDVRKVCIITANEKLGKYWGPDATKELLQVIFPDTRWTSDSDGCSPQAIKESKAYHRMLIDKKQGKEKKCVPKCKGKTCRRLKKSLNKLSKDVGKNWHWTDDEELCGKKNKYGSDGRKVCSKLLGHDSSHKLHAYWGDASTNCRGDEAYPGCIPGEQLRLAYDSEG